MENFIQLLSLGKQSRSCGNIWLPIGILWTLIALVTSTVIEKRIKGAQVGLVDETKTVIKNRIDEVEKLSEEEVEVLITMIRSLSKPKSGK